MLRKDTSRTYQWVPLPRTEKAEEIDNPYRGLYSLYRFYAESEKVQPTLEDIKDIKICNKQRLCLIEINLVEFNACEISKVALDTIEQILLYFIGLEKQLILRFLYDWDGKAVIQEPKDFEVIILHMTQLEDILKRYQDHIYIIQGLFIGSWGEMHSSRYTDERYLTRLAKKLAECSGEKTQIALRCPNIWRMIYKSYHPLDVSAAFDGTQIARASLFNDGMLASETDFGTYGTVLFTSAKSYEEKWMRKDELEFQNKLCRYVSNGGEVINSCSYNNTSNAMEDLRKMRVSYLHKEYDKEVLDKWRNEKSGVKKSIWKNSSAYDYIIAHLGYRYYMEAVQFSEIKNSNKQYKVGLQMMNHGFAPSYHKFHVKIVVRNAAYTYREEYQVDTDTRYWMPEKIIELEALITLEKGETYVIGIGIYDERSKQWIKLANTFSNADYMGIYAIGNVVMK